MTQQDPKRCEYECVATERKNCTYQYGSNLCPCPCHSPDLPERCGRCMKEKCTITDGIVTCKRVDFRNSKTHCHGDCTPAPTEEEYTVANAVRDLTHLGGTVLTKGRATEILEKLLASQRCNKCEYRNYVQG